MTNPSPITLDRAKIEAAIETLRFNANHLIAEDDKADALHTLDIARDIMDGVASDLLEALSHTAPSGSDMVLVPREDVEDARDLLRLYGRRQPEWAALAGRIDAALTAPPATQPQGER